VSAPGPVFVGGAFRSGTHVLAHLVGRHPDYFTLAREMFFHAAERGVPAYLAGTIDRREFASDLLGRWWRRKAPWHPEGERGLHQSIPAEEFDAAVAAFLTGPADDRVGACRTLISSLFDPLAAEAGKPAWVEHTPRNIWAAKELSTLFPHAKFIHVVRDGRDQACSVVRLPFRGDSVEDELRVWARDLRMGEAGSRSLAPEQLLVIHLEDLVLLDREASLERLVAFLAPGEVEPMREFFDSEVTAERAHIGRSRVELEPGERERIDALYRDLLDELRAERVSCLPPEREATVSFSGPTAAHPFDPWSFRNAET
jgi:hypothetical protein